MTHYDAIVVGAGAGGGVAANVLAKAGKRVLLLERGRHLTFDDVGRDHLRNQRTSLYGHNAGPDDGNPRVVVDQVGYEHVRLPYQPGYNNNAACVGSGTRVYGAQAWRFMPQDFRMASLYGVPDGSSLADWPINYADVMPYYARIEWEMGVCGEASEMSHLPAYDRPYPMPSMAQTRMSETLRQGAALLGWHTIPVPLLINSVPYHNRPACIRCQHCVGFACPVDAKNGTQNTMIPGALATGRCDLLAETMVERIITDAAGRVTGVAYFDKAGQRIEVQADIVVLCAGAIETARLLLHSATAAEPTGLGNRSDQVGRHLQGHYYPGASGLFPEQLQEGIGPGPGTATCEFNHGNEGIVGGGMLADDFIPLPITFWKGMVPPDLPRWGAANKQFMRDNYRAVRDIRGPVQEIPHPDGRVTLDATVVDKWGIPVARLSGTTHPETVRTAAFMFERAREWLLASGATKVWGAPPELYLSGGQHQAGTCRMGADPSTSVVDPWGKVHGHENLFVADGSVHVTNGGFNPVLTILALSLRTAEAIIRNW
jgi:choline dehydrogenase-like flavoprotein